VSGFNIWREIFDEETRFDDEADLRRIHVTLTSGHVWANRIWFFAKPSLDVNDWKQKVLELRFNSNLQKM
jgi:hypothetical protein